MTQPGDDAIYRAAGFDSCGSFDNPLPRAGQPTLAATRWSSGVASLLASAT